MLMNLLDFVTFTNKGTRKFHNDGGTGLRHYCITCTHTAPRHTDWAHQRLNCASAKELRHLRPTHNHCDHCDIKRHPHLCLSMKVAQLAPAVFDPMDYTVNGFLQARILEWVAFSSPGDLPNPGIKPRSPALQVDSLPSEPHREAQE